MTKTNPQYLRQTGRSILILSSPHYSVFQVEVSEVISPSRSVYIPFFSTLAPRTSQCGYIVYELPHSTSFSLRHPSSSLQYKQENRRGELLSCAEVSASISSSLAGASSSDIQDTIHPTNPSGRHRSNSVF